MLRDLQRTSGYGEAQVKHLVKRVRAGQKLCKRYRAPAHAFARRYTGADVLWLAARDRAFGTMSGPATAHRLQRAFSDYGDARYERRSQRSVSHLYSLRASPVYQRQRVRHTKTRPSNISIAIGGAPAPEGRAGFIRIDSVHQDDLDGVKGDYDINAVDCVTPWQRVACCEQISAAFLLPVIEQMLQSFPFTVLGFHADNGSEYIHHRVAEWLDKLRAEFTKSRPRHSNDNGLAETKNAVVVRRVFGYAHIPQRFAALINAFCSRHLTAFINRHRPCLFATELADPRKPGRLRKVYRHAEVMTPLDKLASRPAAMQTLPPGVPLQTLQAQARAMSDPQAALRMNEARQALLKTIQRRQA
ncbi:MAG: integrase [Burkholderiales bacterium]